MSAPTLPRVAGAVDRHLTGLDQRIDTLHESIDILATRLANARADLVEAETERTEWLALRDQLAQAES